MEVPSNALPSTDRAWHKQWLWIGLMCHEQKRFGASLPARTPGMGAMWEARLCCRVREGPELRGTEGLCSRPTPQQGRCSAMGPLPRSGKEKQPKVTSRQEILDHQLLWNRPSLAMGSLVERHPPH